MAAWANLCPAVVFHLALDISHVVVPTASECRKVVLVNNITILLVAIDAH